MEGGPRHSFGGFNIYVNLRIEFFLVKGGSGHELIHITKTCKLCNFGM